MGYHLLTNSQICHEVIEATVPISLVYYSHIPTAAIALLMGVFVFLKDRTLASKLLLALTVTFSLWLAIDQVVWLHNYNTILTMFLWSNFEILDILFFVLTLYFAYAFLDKKDISFSLKSVLSLLLLPVILLSPGMAYLTGFTFVDCEAWGHETLLLDYVFLVEMLITLWIVVVMVMRYRSSDSNSRHSILILASGVCFFLLSFFGAGYIADHTENYDYELYGHFGMTVFIVTLGYLIVRYKAFNIKMIAAQALVVAQFLLIASMFTFVQSSMNITLIAVTLVFTTVAGYFLIRGVKREVRQREQIEELAQSLKKANNRLKELDKMKSEFVSIASHQLRSPLTSIRGYASMILEGSYGKVSEKTAEAVQRIAESSRYMALSVEDYLNVSRIEAGNMKYEMSDFNLKETASKVVDELRPAILKKGLLVMFKSDCYGSEMVHADIGKTRQVITNLIDNAMKYTPKGSITVIAHDDVKKMKMYVTIQDTGIGMSKETLEGVFEKFVRAKNANNVNTTGTGLGLFVAKKMIENMGGRVWAESQGEGKGSTFHVELSLLPGQPRLMTK